MVENLKYDGLSVYVKINGTALINSAKFIRTKYDKPTGGIHEEFISHFNCSCEKAKYSPVYELTFKSERDMMYFILHT